MPRALKIRWASSNYRLGRDDGIRIRIDAECPEGMSPKIFAYRMLPLTPQGQQAGHFSHICSPVDLEEYPEDGPCPGTSPEWFRLSFVDVLVRSTEEAQNLVQIVREDVTRLISTLNRTDTLFFGGEDTYGGDFCPFSSESAGSESENGSLSGFSSDSSSSDSDCPPSSSMSASNSSSSSI